MKFKKQIKERNQALINSDLEYIARMVGANPSDPAVEICLHKVRYECTDIPAELRHQSGDWLRSRRFSRMVDLPLLPEGQLPE